MPKWSSLAARAVILGLAGLTMPAHAEALRLTDEQMNMIKAGQDPWLGYILRLARYDPDRYYALLARSIGTYGSLPIAPIAGPVTNIGSIAPNLY